MDGVSLYILAGGMSALVTLLIVSGHSRVWWLDDRKLLLLFASFFLWPALLLMFWYKRQRAVGDKPVPHPVLWMHDREAPVYLRFLGRAWRIPFRHRRVRTLGRLTFLIRPRPTLDAPLLFSRGRMIITPLFCQVQVCWRGNTSVSTAQMF